MSTRDIQGNEFIMENGKIRVQFCAGDGRNFNGGVNYLLSMDKAIYAECPIPEDTEVEEDYGYLTMMDAIRKEADKIGFDLSGYRFQYDDFDPSFFTEDASADCDVCVELEVDDE